MEKSGAPVKSLTDDNGSCQVVYLHVRDRQRIGEAKHSMTFCLQWKEVDSLGESQESCSTASSAVFGRQPFNASSERSLPKAFAQDRKLGLELPRAESHTLASSCMVTPRRNHSITSHPPRSRRRLDMTELRANFVTLPSTTTSPTKRSPSRRSTTPLYRPSLVRIRLKDFRRRKAVCHLAPGEHVTR